MEESLHAYQTAELMVSTVMSLIFSAQYKIKLVHTVHSFKDLITQMGFINSNQQNHKTTRSSEDVMLLSNIYI